MERMILSSISQPTINVIKSEDTWFTDAQHVNDISIDDTHKDKSVKDFKVVSKVSINLNDTESSEFNKNVNEELKSNQSTNQKSKKGASKSKALYLVKLFSSWRNGGNKR